MGVSLKDELLAYGDALKDVKMDGVYTLRAVKVNTNPTQKGNDSLNITFKVISAEHKGQEIYQMFSHTPGNEAAARMFFKRMAGLGITREMLINEDPSFEELGTRILRDEVTIKAVVKNDEYGNKIKNITDTVKGVKPRGAAKSKAASAAPAEDDSVETEDDSTAVIPDGEQMNWDE